MDGRPVGGKGRERRQVGGWGAVGGPSRQRWKEPVGGRLSLRRVSGCEAAGGRLVRIPKAQLAATERACGWQGRLGA